MAIICSLYWIRQSIPLTHHSMENRLFAGNLFIKHPHLVIFEMLADVSTRVVTHRTCWLFLLSHELLLIFISMQTLEHIDFTLILMYIHTCRHTHVDIHTSYMRIVMSAWLFAVTFAHHHPIGTAHAYGGY